VGAQHVAQQLAEQSHIVSQRLVRIGVHSLTIAHDEASRALLITCARKRGVL
jgi:hypothetical protein